MAALLVFATILLGFAAVHPESLIRRSRVARRHCCRLGQAQRLVRRRPSSATEYATLSHRLPFFLFMALRESRLLGRARGRGRRETRGNSLAGRWFRPAAR